MYWIFKKNWYKSISFIFDVIISFNFYLIWILLNQQCKHVIKHINNCFVPSLAYPLKVDGKRQFDTRVLVFKMPRSKNKKFKIEVKIMFKLKSLISMIDN